MMYPTLKLAQLALHYCKENNIKHIVISPGSRNAPLTIGFSNDAFFNSYSVVDERSAGFFALGIAQQIQQPVALVCTSGSALLNYYPAIAEAYYSNIPLLILSADRPKHLLEIGDGQTIKQENVYANHILKSICLDEIALEKSSIQFNEAIQIAKEKSGPVHINIPFDEPLYNTTSTKYNFVKIKKTPKKTLLNETPLEVDFLEKFAKIWNTSSKKMILIGVHYPSELLQKQIEHVLKDLSVLVLTETTSNIYSLNTINSIDKLIIPLSKKELQDLQPEILVTFGGMVVSKKIKQFLRNYQPKHHWHIDKNRSQDTYHCLTQHFKISIELFFSQFFFLTKNVESDYQKKFLEIKEKRIKKHQNFLKKAVFSDLKVFDVVLNSFPKEKIQLQIGNSSIIRYTQLFDLPTNNTVFCNRGTSGIDGSTSTAIGASFIEKNQTVLITGDISFFYDSNALWNKYIKPNFRIILINNSGGGIFRFIEGPKSTKSLDYFETSHSLTAEHLCKMFNFEYIIVNNLPNLTKKLSDFYQESSQPKLLEIQTPKEMNDVVLKKYFKSLA